MAQNITLMGASYPDVPSVVLPKTGGGTASFTDVTDTTATASDVASGKYFYNAAGEKVEGSASGGGTGGVLIEDTTDTAGGTVRTITAVNISGTKSITSNGNNIDVTSYEKVDVAVPSPSLETVTNVTPTESSQTVQPGQGYDGLASVQINAIPSQYKDTSDATATAGHILYGQTAYGPSGLITGNIPSLAAQTITPGTSDQTLAAGQYLSGAQTISGDANLVAANILAGVSIFGVAGTASGGGGGLEYETGTFSPTDADVARPTINFSKTHATVPAIVVMSDVTGTNFQLNYTNAFWYYIEPYKLWGTGFPYSTSALRYGYVGYAYWPKSATMTVTGTIIAYNSDSTSGTMTSDCARYWVTESGFMPGSASTSRYWRSVRTYKWIAVWAPTT